MSRQQDTIFALATAPGRAGVAVLRLSGPQSGIILKRITSLALPPPRMAQLRQFIDPATNTSLDTGLALWFPFPGSYTGEDVVELHIHGGQAVINAFLTVLANQPFTRPAVAGEFTRRAFDNGKLDLTGVEGLADLLAAETEAQRRQALWQLQGRLGELYQGWRAGLTGLLAHIEAHIDFSDAELPENLLDQARPRLMSLISEISLHLDDGHRGEILRRGVQIAIIGPPNVGKSSLINALARRDAAIVTPQPGTTRDVVEVHLDLGGYLVTLADTAGLRASRDPVEVEGIRRARARAAQADLVLAVFDAQAWPQLDAGTLGLTENNMIRLINKVDLKPEIVAAAKQQGFLVISTLRGDGLAELMQHIQTLVVSRLGSGEAPGLTRARHRLELQDCLDNLTRAAQLNLDIELLAENLRLAARALGRITGRVDVEDLLDVIFADFCIGK